MAQVRFVQVLGLGVGDFDLEFISSNSSIQPPEIDSTSGVEIETFNYKHGDEWKKLTRTAGKIK